MELYYDIRSPFCRSVLMVAKQLNIELKLNKLDLMENEHLADSFVRINPQHCLPTLVDDDLILWESRAILIYLVEKYGSASCSLYPKDVELRARVNQRLYFDAMFYERYRVYISPWFEDKNEEDPQALVQLTDAIELLNGFLSQNSFVAGDELTIADLAILATVSSLEMIRMDLSKYLAIQKWYEQCKMTVPGYEEINVPGLERGRLILDALGK